MNLPSQVLQDWKPPLIVSLDHSDVWHEIKSASPGTIIVGRMSQGSEPNFADEGIDPLVAARGHCDAVLPWAERMGDTYDYWQGLNEPVLNTVEAMRRFADFEAERARIMDGHGYQVAVGSFAVGNPPRLPLWGKFAPALEAALQFKGVLALHEYGWPTMDRQSPWYALRHRKVYEGEPRHKWAGFPAHLRNLPLLITECGLDGGIVQNQSPRGWRVLYGDNPARYLKQLAWYDAELQEDPYVAGAAVFCFCKADDARWGTFDISGGFLQELARNAKPIYRLPELLEREPPPEEESMMEQVLARLDRIIEMLQ